MKRTPDLFTQHDDRLRGKLERARALLSEAIDDANHIPAPPDSWLARARAELEEKE